MLGSQDPRSKFHEFLSTQSSMSNNGDECVGSNCLAINGFYAASIPWLGHPESKIIVSTQIQTLDIICFMSSSEDLDLNLVNEAGKVMTDIEKDVIFNSADIKKAVFKIQNPLENLQGKYYCQNSQGLESLNFVEIIKGVDLDQQIWTTWSSWSQCQKVQEEKISRSRQNLNSNQLQVQKRFCRCSDLKELPRPR